MEAQVASGQMTLAEEKRALQDVSALKRQKKSFEAFDSQEDSIEMEKKKVDGLRQRLDALQPEGKRLKDLLDEQFTLLRSLDSEKNDGHSKVKVLIEEREKIGKEIGELMTQRRELYAENKKQNDEWYSYQREEKARRAEQYRLEKTEREKQKKIEAVQRAKEQAEIPAFEVEINTCNALVNLMQQLQGGGAVNAAATNGTTTAASAHVPVSNESAALPKGFTALKKKSDRMDEETLFAGNKKKSAKQQNSSSSSGKEQLKFDLAVLDQFLSLKISVPTTKGDIPQTVDSLKEKKAFFLENQDRVTKENIQKAKDLEEKLLKSIDEPVEAAVGETAAVVEEEAAVVVVEDTPGV